MYWPPCLRTIALVQWSIDFEDNFGSRLYDQAIAGSVESGLFQSAPEDNAMWPPNRYVDNHNFNRSLGYGTDDDEPGWETDKDVDEGLGSDGCLGLPFAEHGLGIKGVPMNAKTLESHH